LLVAGRSDAILHVRNGKGGEVALPPLALTTVVEDAGVFCFQIVQTAPDALALRLDAAEEAAGATTIWKKAASILHRYLVAQGLPEVRIFHDRTPPRRSARSGKLCRVLDGRKDSNALER